MWWPLEKFCFLYWYVLHSACLSVLKTKNNRQLSTASTSTQLRMANDEVVVALLAPSSRAMNIDQYAISYHCRQVGVPLVCVLHYVSWGWDMGLGMKRGILNVFIILKKQQSIMTQWLVKIRIGDYWEDEAILGPPA